MDFLQRSMRQLMPQISTLITGAAVPTSIPGLSEIDNVIYLGDIDTAMPLQGLNVNLGGKTTIDIRGSQPLVSSFSKFMSESSAATIALGLKIGTGKMLVPGSSLTLTNNGATTPAIFSYSNQGNGKPIIAGQSVVLANSSQIFRGFKGLMLTASANVSTVDVFFKDGSNDTWAITDVDADFAIKNPSEANGRLDAVVSTIDNRPDKIDYVRVNAGAGGNVTVLEIKW